MKRSKWNVFVAIAIIILLFLIAIEAINTNRVTAPINKAEQEKAILIAEQFLYDELQVPTYKVFVGKTGKYFYPESGRRKVIEVTISYEDKNIRTLVDVQDNVVVQVSRTDNFYWMNNLGE